MEKEGSGMMEVGVVVRVGRRREERGEASGGVREKEGTGEQQVRFCR